jgi:hypothetical protein
MHNPLERRRAMQVLKTVRNRELLRELHELESALLTAVGTEHDLIESRRNAVLTKLRGDCRDSDPSKRAA